MTSALEGKIIHRLQLDERCSNVRKRKRDDKPSTETKKDQKEVWESSGLIFIPNDTSSYPEYLLSIPQALLKMACDASLNQHDVRVTHYSVISLFSTDKMKTTKRSALLEVHSNGLELKNTASITCSNDPSCSDIWTLSQFHRREVLDDEEMKAEKKRKYNIVATVDAISPIISMDPNDPFALVELYDNDFGSGENSCVLVLTCAKDLLCHSAIFPGDNITFYKIRRQRWPVSDILKKDKKRIYQYLGRRIPSFVFTSNAESRISWQRSTKIPPIPPTAVPLVSLEGKIGHVETTCIPNTSVVCPHWVEILDRQTKKPVGKLYLTHFPMSATLQLGMQKGAIVRAINIHKLCEPSPVSNKLLVFGACLRSTLTIVQVASDPSNDSGHPSVDSKDDMLVNSSDEVSPTVFQTQPSPLIEPRKRVDNFKLSVKGILPYRLNKIRLSYHHYEYRSHIEDWLDNNFLHSTSFEFLALPPVSALIDLVGQDGTKLAVSDSEAQIGDRLQSRITTTRNPYAEFFDHGDDDLRREDSSMRSCGCEMSRHHFLTRFGTTFVGLHKIRTTSLRLFAARFTKLIDQQKAYGRSGGWTGSIHLESGDFLSELHQHENPLCRDGFELYTGGHVVEFRTDRTTPASISDKYCQMPVSFSKSSNLFKGDFVVGCVRKIIISCLCLFQPKSADDSQGSNNLRIQETSLPPIRKVYFNDESLVGSCTLMRLGQFVLVVSVQIVCDGPPITFGTVKNKKATPTPSHEPRMETIESCLSSPQLLMSTPNFDCTKGLLLRQRFVHSKVNHKGYCQCCVLTLCSVPTNSTTTTQLKGASHLQTMDLKLSVPCTNESLALFKNSLTLLSEGLPIVEDQCVLGTAWWTLADSGRTCALVSGGWDEFENASSRVQGDCGITICLPSSAMKVANRGYVRCACQSNEIEATFDVVEMRKNMDLSNPSENNSRAELAVCDFMGGRRVYEGMLDQRPTRRRVFGPNSSRPIGELVDAPHAPKVTISDLFRLVCHSLQNKASMSLSPSLVQSLSGAHFLGVLFCQVQCICSKCFQVLKDPRPENKNSKKNKNKDDMDERSFWHLPAAGESLDGIAVVRNHYCKLPPHILHSKLRCPNNHSPDAYQVLWECSGIVDDGTGQAKLYAAREAAMTLLGMNAFTLQSIEEGVWSTPTGTLRFSKSIPPSAHLHQRLQGVRHLNNPLQRLPPSIRAEYLLQHHCRSSAAPKRRLEYFIRCKPLSDKIAYLHHTMTESSFMSNRESALANQEAATYALPPLKLVLVDMACPTLENQFPEL